MKKKTEEEQETKIEKMDENRLLSVDEVMEYLKIGRDKAYALFRLESFPAIHLNKQGLVFEQDLVSWLKLHRGCTVYL